MSVLIDSNRISQVQIAGTAQSGVAKINFASGATGSINSSQPDQLDITISGGGGGGGYTTVQAAGTPLTQRTNINFAGALTAVDNAGSTRTDIALTTSPSSAATIVGTGRQVLSGTGLTGGGDLTADRTLTVGASQTTISSIVAPAATALTVTGQAASTWSTNSGALTVNGSGGLNLQNSGTTVIALTSALATVTGGITQSSGAVSLTGNGASALTTSSGALTLTSAAAATWSSSSGALTVNGTGGLNLQSNSATVCAINSTGQGVTYTPAAASSGTPGGWRVTSPAHTTLTAADTNDVLIDGTATCQFTAGSTIAALRQVRIIARTYSSASAQTVTNAATLSISGPPIAAGSLSFTAAATYALRLESGNINLASGGIIFSGAGTGLIHASGITYTTQLAAASASDNHVFTSNATRTAGTLIAAQNNGTTRMSVPFHGGITVAQAAVSTGVPQLLSLTGGSHTTMTASTEVNFVDVNQTSVQWATGAIASQRAYRFRNPTLTFVGASTVTSAATVSIDAAPTAGTNATITNSYALWVQAGATLLGGAFGCNGASPASLQTSVLLTNNVTSGGSANTIANFTDLTVYANDSNAIRNDIYQLSQKINEMNAVLRTFGFVS